MLLTRMTLQVEVFILMGNYENILPAMVEITKLHSKNVISQMIHTKPWMVGSVS